MNNNGEKGINNHEDNYNYSNNNRKNDDESEVVRHVGNGKEEDDNMKTHISEQCSMCRGDK